MLIDDYINYIEEYKKVYDKSLVLMQVGSFYEIYGIENAGADVDSVCELLDIQSTRKNKSNTTVDRTNPKMAGIPLFVLTKYLDILLDNGYTIVIVEQTTLPPNPKRQVTRIISPATREIESSVENNYLMCLYFTTGVSKTKKFIIASITYVDVNTNKSYIFETVESDSQLNIEDVLKTINNNKPSEIVIFTDTKTKADEVIMAQLRECVNQLDVNCIHNKLDTFIDDTFFKLSYHKNVLEKVFRNTGMLSVIEFLNLETHPISIICYTYLMQFIYEHNEKILQGMSQPVFFENIKYLSLINNVVTNLNIVNTNSNTPTSSVLNILNKCKTAMGKRYFKHCLLNPLINVGQIQKRYDVCEYFIKNGTYETIREYLSKISDLDRLFKKIQVVDIEPSRFLSIDKSLDAVFVLIESLFMNKFDFDIVTWDKTKTDKLKEFIVYYKTRLNFEEMDKVNSFQITKNIFKQDIHPTLDQMQHEIITLENIFENICYCLNGGDNSDFGFKLEISKGRTKDKISRTITVTKHRYDNLLKDPQTRFTINNLLHEKCNIDLSDIKTESFSSTNKTTLKIIFKNMESEQLKLIELQNKFNDEVYTLYKKEIDNYNSEFSSIFDPLTTFVSEIDFYCNNASIAVQKCYSKPIISDTEDSFINAIKIRHPIIETINTDTPYIANDIEIGTDNNKGMLLYGQNSTGKSSLMKSVGINLILAQAGMYVACKQFEFSPYDHIFCRIPGGDNLFKNQSTFVAEINELRTILKRSTNRSLIIGDELASGTENTSAISLVASGIITLSKKKSSFIFATHLHEICQLDCVKTLTNISIKHLSVHFDIDTNCLIFDRILKDGNGDVLYGIEIAKSLDLPMEFLLMANQIRQDYTGMKKTILPNKVSTYSKDVFMDLCRICNENCTEVHHITEQKFADYKGFLNDEHIHKNRRSNLVTLCEDCHNKVHSNIITIKGYEQTSEGIKLNFDYNNIQPDDSIKNRCMDLRNRGLSFAKIFETVNREFAGNITLYKVKKLCKI